MYFDSVNPVFYLYLKIRCTNAEFSIVFLEEDSYACKVLIFWWNIYITFKLLRINGWHKNSVFCSSLFQYLFLLLTLQHLHGFGSSGIEYSRLFHLWRFCFSFSVLFSLNHLLLHLSIYSFVVLWFLLLHCSNQNLLNWFYIFHSV
jgi:hypothetical protein